MVYRFLLPLALLFSLCTCDCAQNEPPAPRSITVPTGQDSVALRAALDTMDEATHGAVMDLVLGKPKHNIREIGILVYDGVNDLDLMGPRYVLGQMMGARTRLIALEPGNFTTVMGVEMVPNTIVDSVDELDILVIPGGFRGTIEAAYNENLHAWIRRVDSTTLYTASICTGGWILGATGLLRGRRAVTNWYREDEMLEKYGALPADDRWAHDGKYWTSAGVTAGMDMSLALLADVYGDAYAQGVMLDMEYDPAPPLEGGSPEKTGWMVYQMMEAMYDGGVQPVMDSLEGR